MPTWTCEQCGAQFPDSGTPPAACLICEDERQFVNWKGQAWLTREDLMQRHRLVWRDDGGVVGIGIEPSFAIGQRALLVPEADGCVMWDCIPLVTDDAVDYVRSLGGLKAIAVSHPHYYGAVADWSEAFGDVPIYLHQDDSAFITRPHPRIVSWSENSLRLSDDILLLRTGGHFAGGSVLHWRMGADGRGALFTGDIATVAMDRHSVSFMYSYPNYIPLNAEAPAHRRGGGAVVLRCHLWCLVGSRCRQWRQGGLRYVGRQISRGDCVSRVIRLPSPCFSATRDTMLPRSCAVPGRPSHSDPGQATN